MPRAERTTLVAGIISTLVYCAVAWLYTRYIETDASFAWVLLALFLVRAFFSVIETVAGSGYKLVVPAAGR